MNVHDRRREQVRDKESDRCDGEWVSQEWGL